MLHLSIGLQWCKFDSQLVLTGLALIGQTASFDMLQPRGNYIVSRAALAEVANGACRVPVVE
jgi:hypothetical protein